MSDPRTEPHTPEFAFYRTVGFWAVISGALALVIAFFHIFGPSLQPSPSVGEQIGEIAGDIRRSAWRSFLGLKAPEPEPVPTTNYLFIVVPVLGAIAIVLAVISAAKGEHRRYVVYGTALGIGAIVFQFFWWVAVLIAGVVLLVAIIENIGDIFSF